MIYSTIQPLVLGSNSPRRKQFLTQLGLDFTVYAPAIDESVLPGESPSAYVERMAGEKAMTVMRSYPDSFVLTADTAVCVENTILGKPADHQEAVRMLMSLSGKDHLVLGGICVGHSENSVKKVFSIATRVVFSSFGQDVAEAYVTEGESFDKAGAYGIQGKGAFLVERVEGSYSNVVGLPLAETLRVLCELGVIAISV